MSHGDAGSLRAIILAAGLGTRLGDRSTHCHKCLVPVGGRPILARTLDTLAAAGIQKVIIATGHLGAQVRACANAWSNRLALGYVENERAARTGTACSLALGLAAACAGESVLVIEADVVFGHEALARLLQAPEPEVTLVAPLAAHLSGSVVLCDAGGMVRDWVHVTLQGRRFRRSEAFKTVNVTRLDGRSAAALLDHCAAVGPAAPLEHAMRRLVRARAARIQAVGVGDAAWCEVDTPEDLRLAEELFGADITAGRR